MAVVDWNGVAWDGMGMERTKELGEGGDGREGKGRKADV